MCVYCGLKYMRFLWRNVRRERETEGPILSCVRPVFQTVRLELVLDLCGVCFSWPQTMPGAVPTASNSSRAALSSACGHYQMSSYCISRGSDRYFNSFYASPPEVAGVRVVTFFITSLSESDLLAKRVNTCRQSTFFLSLFLLKNLCSYRHKAVVHHQAAGSK